jgi:hypothetical protein
MPSSSTVLLSPIRDCDRGGPVTLFRLVIGGGMHRRTVGWVVIVGVAIAGVVAVVFALVPDLWDEVKAVAENLDRGRPSPFERNLLIGATAVGAFFAHKRGVGPDARRRARAAWVVAGGAWVYLTWTRQEPWVPDAVTAATVCLTLFALLTVGLVLTRIRRHLHGTWKPNRDFFVVEDPGSPWR